jgi:hypothetical protein
VAAAGGGFLVGSTRYTIKMVTADAASDPAKANTAATQLIRDEGVKVLLGPTEVLSANVVLPQVATSKILWITNTSTYYDQLATPDPKFQYYFSNLPGTASSGDALIRGALHFIPSARTAALVIPDPASNDVVANTYRDVLRKYGLDLPDERIYRVPADTSDFTPLLTRIRAQHPDFLMAGSANVAAAARSRGSGPTWATSRARSSPFQGHSTWAAPARRVANPCPSHFCKTTTVKPTHSTYPGRLRTFSPITTGSMAGRRRPRCHRRSPPRTRRHWSC